MSTTLYVSDPNIWRQFYEDMSGRKIKPYLYAPKISRKYPAYRKSILVPVNSNEGGDTPTRQVTQLPLSWNMLKLTYNEKRRLTSLILIHQGRAREKRSNHKRAPIRKDGL